MNRAGAVRLSVSKTTDGLYAVRRFQPVGRTAWPATAERYDRPSEPSFTTICRDGIPNPRYQSHGELRCTAAGTTRSPLASTVRISRTCRLTNQVSIGRPTGFLTVC